VVRARDGQDLAGAVWLGRKSAVVVALWAGLGCGAPILSGHISLGTQVIARRCRLFYAAVNH
jgi:hypothetical protein